VVEELNHRILGQYDHKVALFQELTGKVHALVEEMLQQQLIEVHSVTSRVKDRNSLRTKINDPDKNYSDFSDLTDIAGVRIITYYEDDVDRVSKILEREFVIDWPINQREKRSRGSRVRCV
jgi:putative GTP pyrophosphokinase